MKEEYNEEKIRIAFSNVKKDILDLEDELKEIKSLILKNKDKKEKNKEISNGNKGVVTTILQQCHNTVTTEKSAINIEDIDKNLRNLDQNIKKFITSLTDKEFLVFMTIYQLEDELKIPPTYEDVSVKLRISLSNLRGYIRELILKEAPVIKQKTSNKIYLSIKEEFRYLKIGDKLMGFRRSFIDTQTQLSDIIEM